MGRETAFAGRDPLAEALAADVARHVNARIAAAGKAALAVSGGRTPAHFLETLAAQPVEWDKTTLTLVDERWVGEDHPRSNARLVREHFKTGASFLPFFIDGLEPEQALPALEERLDGLPLPWAAVVLGMGDDGHTASFFPGGDGLAAALDPPPGRKLAVVRAAAAIEPRVTLTLPAILAADFIALHIEGESKRRTLEAAREPGPVDVMPVRAVLPRATIYWCP